MSDPGICGLCRRRADLQESHIIPKFVSDHQKATSATGFLRTSEGVNRRVQDGLKLPLLCRDCEGLLNQWETPFAAQIYHPWTRREAKTFDYGPWLLKFAVSVSWRALTWYMDSSRGRRKYTDDERDLVENALTAWKDFLLGARPHPGRFEQHMLLFDAIEATDKPGSLPTNINRFLTRGSGINMELRETRPTFIYTKMGKIMLLGLLEIKRPRAWLGTQIHVKHGSIGGNVSVPGEFFDYLKERARIMHTEYNAMSDKQKAVILKTVHRDPDRAASSETFEMMQRDVGMFGEDAVFPKDEEG